MEAELLRKIERLEERAHKQNKIFTGRQAGRMVYMDFKTDRVSRNLFSVTHLQLLSHAQDSKLSGFLEDWFRILDDQELELDPLQLERIFYQKIKDSTALKPYLDQYRMMDETDFNHSYDYLLGSVEKYLE